MGRPAPSHGRACAFDGEAYAAFRDGSDELITKGTVYRDMLDHPLTYHWNKVFLDEWIDMPNNGLLAGVPVEDNHS